MIRLIAILSGIFWVGDVLAQETAAPPTAGIPSASPMIQALPVDMPACPPCLTTICVPEPSTRKTTRVYYDSKCKEYCLPKCRCLAWLWCMEDCACACIKCGKPRTRNVLIKKTKTEECPTLKCVPKKVPIIPACESLPLMTPCETSPQ